MSDVDKNHNSDLTLFHIYLPKLSPRILNCQYQSVLLIGTFSINTYSCQNGSNYTQHCIISIFGSCTIQESDSPLKDFSCSSTRRRSPSSSSKTDLPVKSLLPQVLGQCGGAKGNYDDLVTFETQSTVWITFSEYCCVEEVLLNKSKISLTDVILLEYDPYPLSQCLIMSTRREFIGIPEIVIDSFILVSTIPINSEGNRFRRLIPYQEKLNRREGAGDDEQYNDTTVKDASLGNILRKEVISRCLGMKQLVYRCSLVWKFFRLNDSRELPSNIIALIMLDVFLGTLLTLYFQTLLQSYDNFETVLKVVLELLLKLLDWLSGAPAGLKLNVALNTLFHSFYSYHLHLWESYIGLLEPLLRLLFYGVVNLGYLGFTVQLAMAKDLLSLTTFHIYCLYIYATRLFNVELKTVKSLGRLFLGRKWNPLRQRIDSVTLSLSEMFLGAFGFTVTLFLLPTICVYYVVFLALRLPLLLVESSLEFVIDVFDSLELVTAVLTFTNSYWIADETYLNPVPLEVTALGPTVIKYEIRTHTLTRKFYKVPNIQKAMTETLSKIVESRIITH